MMNDDRADDDTGPENTTADKRQAQFVEIWASAAAAKAAASSCRTASLKLGFWLMVLASRWGSIAPGARERPKAHLNAPAEGCRGRGSAVQRALTDWDGFNAAAGASSRFPSPQTAVG